MPLPSHIQFLQNSGIVLQTSDGKNVEIWELHHTNDDTILSAWAKHFREHYCKDSEIDELRAGPNLSKKDYLNTIKFPSSTLRPGPSTRSGDFGEILVADFLEFVENYEVLSRHTRYSNKTTPNESTKGSDIIGFRLVDHPDPNPKDELAIFEAKAKFTGGIKGAKKRLQNAIDDSAKDKMRIAVSLNAMWQRFHDKNMDIEAEKVRRFQNEVDNPYKTTNGAVALVGVNNYSDLMASTADACNHPLKSSLRLIIIKGRDMMNLVHELYRRAADEA
ncbi:MAG: DUF1837 domain-containing protein [Holosporales bacterium]|jgi:hypothetical protein|nr:DUF1837 domain-containing protein [Holosporales bacterium]